MEENILEYKRKKFIIPKLSELGFTSYPIRKSLLRAIDELKIVINGSVIDLGCGVMPYKEYLMENKRITTYIGVDWESGSYIKFVKPDLYWDGSSIPVEDNSVDWVIATELLEHLFDTKAILLEIKRILKPGGKLFFTVPCIMPLHEVPYDEYRFTPYSLKKHFDKVGFVKADIKALGGINMSFAIMFGIWYDNTKMNRVFRRLIKILFTPIYNLLLKYDNNNLIFNNSQYPSGLYGFVKK